MVTGEPEGHKGYESHEGQDSDEGLEGQDGDEEHEGQDGDEEHEGYEGQDGDEEHEGHEAGCTGHSQGHEEASRDSREGQGPSVGQGADAPLSASE